MKVQVRKTYEVVCHPDLILRVEPYGGPRREDEDVDDWIVWSETLPRRYLFGRGPTPEAALVNLGRSFELIGQELQTLVVDTPSPQSKIKTDKPCSGASPIQTKEA